MMSMQSGYLTICVLVVIAGAILPEKASGQTFTCPKEHEMEGDLVLPGGTGVAFCVNRKHVPVCGVRRYQIDGDGEKDICTTTKGKQTGIPKCVVPVKNGRIEHVSGQDRCVATTRLRTCPKGFTMQGNMTGRGAVFCLKPASETLRKNRPGCGTRRYQQDAEGNKDICTTTKGRKTGEPKCLGGHKSIRAGADRCVNRTAEKRRKPT